MKLTIIYDNEVYIKGIGLKPDWGFSCLIETDEKIILFDTGAKGNILLNNMEKLDKDPGDIDKIVISHEHWDHNGGLKDLMALVGHVELYRIGKKSIGENMCLISIEESQEITEGIYTTGRIKGVTDEQSLILKGEKGWYILTGCSHPSVKEILNVAKQYGDIIGIVGGFHDFNNFSILDDLDLICPCHCTRHKKTIQKIYSTSYSKCGVGRVIEA